MESIYKTLKNGIQGLLILSLLTAGIDGCIRLCGGFRSSENPKLQVSVSREGASYSEHPGLIYIDGVPTGSLDKVIDYTSGELHERSSTNLTERDYLEFKRLRKSASEQNMVYMPGL